MRHQGLFAVLALLLFSASMVYYIYAKGIEGDYDLVQREGFFKAWEIKSRQKEALSSPQQAVPSSPISALENGTNTQNTTQKLTSQTPVGDSDVLTGDSLADDNVPVDADVTLPTLKAPRIQSIPWEEWEVKRAFNQASARFSRLLPAGTSVVEPFRPRNVEKTIFEGRPTAFTVGLWIDPLARGKLPTISKSTIEGYLDDHLLAIQPVVLKTSTGYSFTGEVQCAFFDRSNPRNTIDPEAMIATAVREFRVLGIYDDASPDMTAKTLVMAFRFMKQENELNLVIGKPVEAFELMILHLPDNGSAEFSMLSFATAEERGQLQRLASVDFDRLLSDPPVQATIRFEEFRMMGIYPADPVVTGIRNRIESTVSVTEVQKRLLNSGEDETIMLSKILDNFPD